MAVHGTLKSMPLPELLGWLAHARRSGCLRVELGDGGIRRLQFRDGEIEACSSDYPPTLLGQFLIAHGRIGEKDLQAALTEQVATGENLGTLLVRRGKLRAEEVQPFLAEKAQETIFGIFEREDGGFTFDPDAGPVANGVTVRLRTEEILMEGARRKDEHERARKVLPDDTAVLVQCAVPVPPVLAQMPAAQRILALVDGRRTIRDLVLEARGTEHNVLNFLARMVEFGVLRIVHPGSGADAGAPAPPADALDRARQALAEGDPRTAYDLLSAALRAGLSSPEAFSLHQEAEAETLAELYAGRLGPDRVPVVVGQPGDRTAEERFLLGLIDGRTTIRALVWLSPLRPLAVLLGLERLTRDGLVALADAA
jgi:hypothetical protein